MAWLLGQSVWDWLSWFGKLLAIFFIPSVLLQRKTRPMAGLVWILCLWEIPYLGVVLWWVMGRTHLRRRKRKRRRAHDEMLRSLGALRERIDVAPLTDLSVLELRSSQHQTRVLLNDSEEGIFPTTAGNSVEPLLSGRVAFESFEQAIRAAKHHIHFEFYIWQRDQTGRHFRDLLIERAREGVEVRVLYDAVGGAPVHGRFMKPLIEAGGQAAPFLPLNLFERRLRVNFRNHRKIIVVDGQVGFTGGINIGEEYHDWEDVAFRIEGPAVYQLQEVFAEDWYFATSEDVAEPKYFNAPRLQSPAQRLGAQAWAADSRAPEPQSGKEAPDHQAKEIDSDSIADTTSKVDDFDAAADASQGVKPQEEPSALFESEECLREIAPQEKHPQEKTDEAAQDATHEEFKLSAEYLERGYTPPSECIARVISSGPDLLHRTVHQAFFLAITSARERIALVTPYFVPDSSIMAALTTAALRGVEVRVLVPAKGYSDIALTRIAGQGFYEELMQAGVQILEYESRILHAKVLLIDDEWSLIGSANMDIRSFRLNFEINCILYSPPLNAHLSAWFENLATFSHPVDPQSFAKRPRSVQLSEAAARLFSPLL